MPVNDPLLKFRAEFPILERKTYLVSHSLGAMPRGVAERMQEYAQIWAHEGVGAWQTEWWDLPIRVGNVIAPLIGAGAGEIAMVPNVSLAQATVLSAVPFDGRRNRIVMTELDFPSVRYVFEQMAPRLGAEIVTVPSDDGFSISDDKILAAIDERTALVCVSHVLFRSAWIMNVGAICRKAHEHGALVSLDAFHAVGVIPVDVGALGVDFLTGGVLKWLCGGPGGSFLYVAPRVQEFAKPFITGWQAHARPFEFEGSMEYAPGIWGWLGGTPAIPALYAASAGPELLGKVGIHAIREKSMRLTALIAEMASERGFRINSPTDPERRAGTVSIETPVTLEVYQHLLDRDIMVDYRPGAGIRVAPHFYNSEQEVEHLFHEIDACLEGRGLGHLSQP